MGEVMSIGRTFEEALQKAIRMLQVGMYGVVCNEVTFDELEKELERPTDRRVFAVAEAVRNMDIDRVHDLTQIDRWFLYKIRNIVHMEKQLRAFSIQNLPPEQLRAAKQLGFSDKQIALALDCEKLEIRKLRQQQGITPFVKQIDTLAAEYPAQTNYLYLTYNARKTT